VNIYVIYRNGEVISVTTLPRIVQDEFKRGADRIELWRKETLIKAFMDARGFNRFINPKPSEDDETNGGGGYDW